MPPPERPHPAQVLRDLTPRRTRPPDFERFWDKTRAELATIAPEVHRRTVVHGGVAWLRRQGVLAGDPLHPLPQAEPQAELRAETIEFSSLARARIRGYLLRWDGDQDRPLVVHSHGYGSRCEVQWLWAARGMNVLGVDIRGFGRSASALPRRSPWGFMLTGRQRPETHVLRGAVCDFVRAVEVGRQLCDPHVQRLVLQGVSFAGALALMSEALLGVADLLALGVPTFGWAEGRHFLVRAGSGTEVNAYLEDHPYEAEDLMLVLRYFDTMNFADLVTCPTLLGIGVKDEVVPSPTVYAVANHLRGPREIIEFPVSHSTAPERHLWQHFENRWAQLASTGLPGDFGARTAPVEYHAWIAPEAR